MNVDVIKEVDRENIIWLIYLFIIGANFISNFFVEKYLYTMDEVNRKIFRVINIMVLFISLIIYINYTIDAYKNIKKEPTLLYRKFVFFASIIVLIGGLIYLVVEIYKTNNPEISII